MKSSFTFSKHKEFSLKRFFLTLKFPVGMCYFKCLHSNFFFFFNCIGSHRSNNIFLKLVYFFYENQIKTSQKTQFLKPNILIIISIIAELNLQLKITKTYCEEITSVHFELYKIATALRF